MGLRLFSAAVGLLSAAVLLVAAGWNGGTVGESARGTLYYVRGVRDADLPNTPFYRYQVMAWTGAGPARVLAAPTRLLPMSEVRVRLIPSSRLILANLETALVAYDAATGAERFRYDAPQDFTIYSQAVRQDGGAVAFTEFRNVVEGGRGRWDYAVKVLDVPSGAVRVLATGVMPGGSIRGVPVPAAWITGADAILLRGITFSDGCCVWGRVGTNGGPLEEVPLPWGISSPDGVWFISDSHQGSGIGCYTPQHEALLFNLRTLRSITLASDPQRVFALLPAWSPASDAVIFTSSALRPSPEPRCTVEPDPATTQHLLATVDGQVQPLAPHDPRIAAWRASASVAEVAVRCERPGGRVWDCVPARLEVAGRTVDRGGPFAVLGWLP